MEVSFDRTTENIKIDRASITENSTFSITPRDQSFSPSVHGDAVFAISMSNGFPSLAWSGCIFSPETLLYNCGYLCTVAGSFQLDVRIVSQEGQTRHIVGSPFDVRLVPSDVAFVSASPPTAVSAGSNCTFWVSSFDRYGNSALVDAFSKSISVYSGAAISVGKNATSGSAVTFNSLGDGRYLAWLLPVVAGPNQLSLFRYDTASETLHTISGSPFALDVVAGPVFVPNTLFKFGFDLDDTPTDYARDLITFSLIFRDRFGNDVPATSDFVEFAVSFAQLDAPLGLPRLTGIGYVAGTSVSLLLPQFFSPCHADSRVCVGFVLPFSKFLLSYCCQGRLSITAAGRWSVGVLANGQHILNSPVTVQILAGDPSPLEIGCSVSGSGLFRSSFLFSPTTLVRRH